jgi:hypothetical protein
MASQFHLADLLEIAAAQIPDCIAIKSDAGQKNDSWAREVASSA